MHNNNSTRNIISFFSGYGGLEKGISSALGGNTRTIAYVERDAFPVANLVQKMEQGLMDPAPVFTDVTTVPYRKFRGLVDIACGGVPCQPHSHAGKRKGGSDERFLFDIFIEGMAEMWPGIIFIENVEGLLSSKMPDGSLCIRYVLNRLEEIGYCVEDSKGQPLIGIFSASEVGAPHQRKRVFILAHRQDNNGWLSENRPHNKSKRESGSGGFEADGTDVAHQQQQGLQGHAGDVNRQGGEPGGEDRSVAEGGVCGVWPSRPGQAQYGWEPPRVVNSESRRITGKQESVWEAKSPRASKVKQLIAEAREDGSVGNSPADNGRTSPARLYNASIRELCSSGFKNTGGVCQTQPPLGMQPDGSSDKMGSPLTSIPLMGYNNPRGDYANQKERARKILQELREQIDAQDVQWTLGGFWSFFTEKILQSELRLDVWPQRICYFIWAIQTVNEVEGKEMPGMWFSEVARSSPQRSEPGEQLKRELDYAMCVLSYEIALERGKEPLERQGEMRDLRKWCEDAWSLSEALVPLTKIWKSTFNEESWANRAYFEAAGLGANRTDELRMLGNGVVPATAEKAFRVLYAELMGTTESSPKPQS